MATIDELKKVRLEKLASIRKFGVDPYPAKVRRDHAVNEARSMDGRSVAIAGRILGMRGHGKLSFWDIMDETGKIQIVLKADIVNPEAFKLVPYFDMGDIVAVQGNVGKTQAGELSIFAENLQILTKTLLPLPNQWHGLKDVEERYRKRYLDTILNIDVKDRLTKRSLIVDAFRDFFTDRGFLEVETPTLQPVYGGGFARPFVTHHNALDSDFYLRISDEMYLKRLIVGGFEKVFEITKVFRNEGVDFDHNPEFTMMEAQIAFEDYDYGMNIVEELLEYVAIRVLGKTEIEYQGAIINFARPWKRYRLVEAVKEYTGLDPLDWKTISEAKAAVLMQKKGDDVESELRKMGSMGEIMAYAFELFVEEQLIQPTIIYDYPREVSPLAKKCEDPRFTQRFEMFVNGSEIGNNYTELNDPVDLKQRFIDEKKREKAGFEEAHQTDYDYLEAIEHGFPPTCGLGIGIDRVVMFMADALSIKEVIPFPTLKPENRKSIKKLTQTISSELVELNPEFRDEYPTASVGYAVIRNIRVKKQDPKLEEEKKALMEEYKGLTVEKIGSYPEIQSYREMYKKMRVDLHSRRPSPEALLRRVAEGKNLYTVNTCVDAYNLVVLKYRVSLGAFDLDRMELPIGVYVAQGGEKIDLLGKGITDIEKGEVYYADKKDPYNLDYNYRDSERTKITEQTKNIIINVDGIYEIDDQRVKQSLVEAISTITRYCGGEVVTAGVVKASGEVIPVNGFEGDNGNAEIGQLPDEKSKRFVAILREGVDPGKLMNALGHMTAGLAGGFDKGSDMCFLQYKDKEGGVHPNISHFPFIVLKANKSSQIRTVREEAKKRGIMFTDFTSTMTVGTSSDQVQKTSETPETDLDYYGICLFGNTDELREFTKKFSLFK